MLILFGIICFLVQIAVSIAKREALRDVTGDPWDGRTLEWSTSSPPPAYNFAFTPVIHDNDAWWDMKQRGYRRPLAGFKTSTCRRTPPPASSWRRSAAIRVRDDLAHLVAGGAAASPP